MPKVSEKAKKKFSIYQKEWYLKKALKTNIKDGKCKYYDNGKCKFKIIGDSAKCRFMGDFKPCYMIRKAASKKFWVV